ncbi:WXG100 family type VII secretion target [Microbacterium oryzae]|uniref:WXG100 family type VII secretion target n=1 Tax=Microbacterium oryzae TaxID=743009 RepID=UPI0025AF4BA5|nr:WXG100 family type VII secretion target [Microbacterium oryzae]MDN3311047.1 WXG100 family type VII secretion target [Microbacterium oryzae]
MPVFSADSDAIVSQSVNVRATCDRLQSESDTLLGQLAELKSVWHGSAAAGFQGVMDQWRSAQLAIQESLASIGQALNIAGTQYADAEQSAASLFR